MSYPVQVLGKACRPIPVIIFSALIAKKFHSIQKWIAVILITGIGNINFHLTHTNGPYHMAHIIF